MTLLALAAVDHIHALLDERTPEGDSLLAGYMASVMAAWAHAQARISELADVELRLSDEIRRLKLALEEQHPDRASVVYHLAQVNAKNRALRHDVQLKQKDIEARNDQLAAMHYVWCAGPCARGWHDSYRCPRLTPAVMGWAIDMLRRTAMRWALQQHREGKDPSAVMEKLTGQPNSLAAAVETECKLQELRAAAVELAKAARAMEYATTRDQHGDCESDDFENGGCGICAAMRMAEKVEAMCK